MVPARLLLFWQSASAAGLLFERSFSPPVTPSSICVICCPCTGARVPCQGQLDKQATLVGLNHGQGQRWGGRGLQCAVSTRSLARSLRLFLELIAEHSAHTAQVVWRTYNIAKYFAYASLPIGILQKPLFFHVPCGLAGAVPDLNRASASLVAVARRW